MNVENESDGELSIFTIILCGVAAVALSVGSVVLFLLQAL